MTFTLAGYNGSASVKMVYSHNWSSVPPKNQIASPIMEISFQKSNCWKEWGENVAYHSFKTINNGICSQNYTLFKQILKYVGHEAR